MRSIGTQMGAVAAPTKTPIARGTTTKAAGTSQRRFQQEWRGTFSGSSRCGEMNTGLQPPVSDAKIGEPSPT